MSSTAGAGDHDVNVRGVGAEPPGENVATGGAWPLPLQTISASSLSTFSRCAEQWRRRYVLGERDRPAAAAVLGQAAHGAAEVNYSQKAVTGTDLPITDVEDAYDDRYRKEVDRAGGESEVDWTMRFGREVLTGNASEIKDRGVPLVRAYHRGVAPTVNPIASEEWFRMEIPGVVPPLVGKIDLITETDKVDLKFGGTAKQRPETSWRIQALTYMLVRDTDNLSNVGHHNFAWHSGSWGSDRYSSRIWTPMEAPELTMERDDTSAEIGQSIVRSMVGAIRAYWTAFGPDDPWPGTGMQHSWACNYCGYRDGPEGCFWWQGPSASQLTLL